MPTPPSAALMKRKARQITDALRAVLAASEGAAFDHLIADLIDREPPLPEHLKHLVQS